MAANDSYGVSLISNTRSRSLKSCFRAQADQVSNQSGPTSSQQQAYLRTLAGTGKVHPQLVRLLDNFDAAITHHVNPAHYNHECALTGLPCPCAFGNSRRDFRNAQGPSRTRAAQEANKSKLSKHRSAVPACLFLLEKLTHAVLVVLEGAWRTRHTRNTGGSAHALRASRVAMTTLLGHSFVLQTS